MHQAAREPFVIMVAPNGARRTKADHPALPITQAEIVDAVADAHAAGAHAAHVHVRDENGQHVLDADRYLRLTEALRARCGNDLIIQITTEALGRYTPTEQRALVDAVRPEAVSIAMRELFADADDEQANADFLAWAASEQIAIQWIIYAPDDLDRLAERIDARTMPEADALLFVLGRYTAGQQSNPVDIVPFLEARKRHPCLQNRPWSVCAFGADETDCLVAAMTLDGDARIGFENNLLHADGSVAADNAERVAALTRTVEKLGFEPATPAEARKRLNVRRP